ncbi:hypothetical protein F7Q91_24215 [Vibrio chagasii]|uniref:Uncharacterized protein n=1 Tax=Vibrio chagasii TaxID=170679 RepID=A0A7V7TG61_9VIBR|nr:hypothetical protein [Vibrio chagasii]KAB0466383.1 hypothetical protein F7Q91_24215 [Vibrio chagasii]
MAELINLDNALLTMLLRPAFGGYDEHGNEKSVDVYLLKLLLQDGRVYIHPCMGEKKQIKALELKMRAKGQINLDYWQQAREAQNY